MILVANFLIGIGQILSAVLSFVIFIVIVRAVVSWVNPDPNNPIVRFLNASTDPMLYWLRRKVKLSAGGVDFSPLVLLFALLFLQYFLCQSLIDYGERLRIEALSAAPAAVRMLDER